MAKRDTLTDEIERLRAENAQLKAQLAALTRTRAESPACLNCGQAHTTLELLADGRHRCPVCHHVWTDADAAAPFRIPRRR